MKTLITLLIATMFFLPVGASATVTGEGTFDLVGFPDSATIGNYGYSTSYTDPVTGEYINVQNYFSYIRENDSNDHHLAAIAYGLDPNNDYRGSGNYHTSSVTGQFHQDTGSEEFTLSAVSPDPLNISAAVGTGFIGRTSFTGSIYDFDFGYDYAFSGNKDSSDDSLTFIVQAKISYFDSEQERYIDIYSDYGTQYLTDYLISDPAENFRTNWVYLSDFDSGNFEGSVIFDYCADDFAVDFDPNQRWAMSWDFGGHAKDTVGSSASGAPVPEPSTILLLGSGLAGLAFYRRKRK